MPHRIESLEDRAMAQEISRNVDHEQISIIWMKKVAMNHRLEVLEFRTTCTKSGGGSRIKSLRVKLVVGEVQFSQAIGDCEDGDAVHEFSKLCQSGFVKVLNPELIKIRKGVEEDKKLPEFEEGQATHRSYMRKRTVKVGNCKEVGTTRKVLYLRELLQDRLGGKSRVIVVSVQSCQVWQGSQRFEEEPSSGSKYACGRFLLR
ncbi:hypothetical protein BGZ47_004507 [Haplosporangium gracile]|nr:hypothetical protein BGZ47_004507 [Haplosporangium gracile]